MTETPRLINVKITFRNTDATEALKRYATQKLTNCLKKLVHQDTDVDVVLSVEKSRQIAEISLYADGTHFKGREVQEDLYAAIDTLADSLANQLRKHKERLTKHH
jgi:putative sigma-54 modulation protein